MNPNLLLTSGIGVCADALMGIPKGRAPLAELLTTLEARMAPGSE